MLQNPCKTLGFKKKMVFKIPPGGEVNHIQPVAYNQAQINRLLSLVQLLSLLDIKFYPFKPNELSYLYQLDQSISVLRVVGWYFSLILKF